MAHAEAPRDRVALHWTLGVLALVVVGAALGFIALPDKRGVSLWDTICAAAGITTTARVEPGPPASTTALAWTPDMLARVDGGRAAGAREIVATCNGCHGENGVGLSDAFPNLAGQPADVIVKALHDYKSGRRQNPIMAPMAAPLSEAQMADLGAHYAAMPATPPGDVRRAPRLVAVGDPLRNIAPCGACHGTHGRKEGAPLLTGQKAAYLAAQLEAFKSGARATDINAQMRTVARAMTPAEIETVVRWYAGDAQPAAPAPRADAP